MPNIWPGRCEMCHSPIPEGSEGITCSEKYHNILVQTFETMYGKYKKVTDDVTGKSYKVPIRYIVEHGLKQMELERFPLWEELVGL